MCSMDEGGAEGIVSPRAGPAFAIGEATMSGGHRENPDGLVSSGETSRLHREELASMSRLHESSTRLTATSDLPSMLYEVLDATMELQGADFGDVQLYDDASGTLKIVAHRGLSQEFLDHFETVDASDTSAGGLALNSGARIIIEDVNTHPDYEPHRGIAASIGYRGVQSTPLCERKTGKPVGMLSTRFREPHRPSERQLRLTDLYARQAADVITFRVAEQRLRESEEHLRLALEAGQMGTWEWDTARGLVKADAALQALFGLPPQDRPLPNEVYRAHKMPEEVRLALEKARKALADGTDIYLEQRVVRTDGEVRWMVSRGRAKRDKSECMIGVSYDITERVRAEQALRESEARLQAAVDLLKLGRYAWNPQTNELNWDETVKAMWGLPANAAVDYEIWRAGIHPDDLARVEAAVRRCADPQGDGVYDIEYRVIRRTDGVERWIATRGLTHFENGRAASFHGIALDVTDRKRIENALERRVEARTRELEEVNRQLRSQIKQRELAEAAVEQLQRLDAIGQITSGVAHDFNNLLSVVLTNSRLLSRKLRDPHDREGVELIRAAAERGAKLAAQLLAFSRKQRLEPQAVDLNSKIMGMRDLLGVTLGGTVHLRTKLAADLWPALVDPTQIELIILNLAINARDAMQSGGSLALETFNAVIDSEPSRPEEPSPGDYVGLAVNDTGAGIPSHVLPRVFEPFFSTKEPGKGSGLGLAQVFGFAKQSGGGVRIETRMGEGTSVTVLLPRAEPANGGREIELGDGDGHRMTGTSRVLIVDDDKRVLVVDDDKAVLNSTLRMLDFLGYAAIPAESGGQALRLIASGIPIDLVLADFAMPGMSGVELAVAIHGARPDLPVILVTGYVDLDVVKRFGEAHILQKPYTEGDLIDKITAALD
jgi:PAS domain S-box-containing protein